MFSADADQPQRGGTPEVRSDALSADERFRLESLPRDRMYRELRVSVQPETAWWRVIRSRAVGVGGDGQGVRRRAGGFEGPPPGGPGFPPPWEFPGPPCSEPSGRRGPPPRDAPDALSRPRRRISQAGDGLRIRVLPSSLLSAGCQRWPGRGQVIGPRCAEFPRTATLSRPPRSPNEIARESACDGPPPRPLVLPGGPLPLSYGRLVIRHGVRFPGGVRQC